jgi:NtrC-family two-component system response regulator AlgB
MEDRKTAEALDVLVVDGDRNIRRTLALCLESEGHRVVCAAGTPEALAEATHRSFDIAFVDLHLGDTDGLDLIPILLTASPWLKVIVMTAYATLDSAVEAMRPGAVDYLAKPYTPAQVASSVRKVMEKHAMELGVGSPVTLSKLEEEHIRRVLSATNSLHEAAEILVIDPATLWRRRKQYGI